ncbi:MAG: CHAT domain-containing protein [Thermoguttaceae bacterium]
MASIRIFGTMAIAVVLGFSGPAIGVAQLATSERTVPTSVYYVGFNALYDGDYLRSALRTFQSECRGSIKTVQSRWIDSICYETMCGECYYQMGMFDKAMAHYTAALQLFQSFPDWMSKVQFSPVIRPAGAGRKIVPWGTSSRQSQLGVYPKTVPILQGQLTLNESYSTGIVQRANMFPITPQEIVRATALAMRRRAMLLGPASKYDSLTNDVLAAASRSIGTPNHWSEVWVDLERGLALSAAGKDSQAVANLNKAVAAAGTYDHPMTCVALLELGRLAMRRGEYPAAAQFFEEATYAAVNYSDGIVLEEAFRCWFLTHVISNSKDFFKPLESAILWAKRNNLRQLHASLLLCAAENRVILGQLRQATAALEEARAVIGRHDMGNGDIGARFQYLSALTAFQQQRIGDGNAALAKAMDYMRHGSLWRFQIAWTDQLYVGGGVTPRAAAELFAEVLREPRAGDWLADPMESIASLMAPIPSAMEHWFELTLDRKEAAVSLDVAERIRRRRFFESLELGGRIESLRWLLEGPKDRLTQEAMLQRQDLLTRYPAYEQLSQKLQRIRDSLAKLPLTPDTKAAVQEQMRGLGEMASLGARQEAMLREIALRREPAEMTFPPLCKTLAMQKRLPDKHAALVFFATARRTYGFLLNNERSTMWEVGPTASLTKPIQTMLHELGQYQQNQELTVKGISESKSKWTVASQHLMEALFKGSSADFSQPFDELIIVPDGVLWYLPFEALQVTADAKSQSWVTRFRVRYAPMLSLVAAPGASRAAGNTAVVVGRLYPRAEESVAREAFEQLAKVVPGAVAIKAPPPAPTSIYSTLFRQLVVLEDIPAAEQNQNPYDWSPAPIDRTKKGNSLADWLALPWGGPDVVVLPGFHTAAEDALKKVKPGPLGNEVFLSVCGLMANGARTVLLSRWRTGGQTSFDLVREFVQELPRTTPADAWQRAVLVVSDSRVNFEAEPRIKRAPTDEPPRASHPFFWAGYLLVDCGAVSDKTSPEGAKPSGKPRTSK